jgi:hypothetical protein
MQFWNQAPGGPSLQMFATCRGPRSMLTRRYRVGMKAIAGFAARCEAAFESFLLAAMSWTIAQVLAGCAEYCQTMAPAFDGHDAVDGPQSSREACRLRSRQTGARGSSGACAEAVYIEAVYAQAAYTKALARSAGRSGSRRWRATATSAVTEFWLRLRQERERKRAMMELRAPGDRMLGSIGISRRQNPCFARPGDHCE